MNVARTDRSDMERREGKKAGIKFTFSFDLLNPLSRVKTTDFSMAFNSKKDLFLPGMKHFKKAILLVFILLGSKLIWAQNEIGPEGHKLLWVVVCIVVVLVAIILSRKRFPKSATKSDNKLFNRQKVRIELTKDTKYYPDRLMLKVENTGDVDVDLDQPLLVFDNFWLKRKFKLKGMANRTFYPLYLERGKTHELDIDLTRFYGHDKRLKKFPKVMVQVQNVKGKKLGSNSVFLRKTLIKF